MKLNNLLRPILKRTASILSITAGSMASVFAQNTGKVSGSLKDTDAKPLDFATVSIIRAKDTAIIKGTLSGETGAYFFDRIPAGVYLVKASSIGYRTVMSE